MCIISKSGRTVESLLSYVVFKELIFGGRNSVLTSAGLLPIAAAGHDIRKLFEGARNMQFSDWSAACKMISYGAVRTLLQEGGEFLELFKYFEGNLRFFGE